MRLIAAGTAVAAVIVACATEEFAGVPAGVVDDCRREVALLADRDPSAENDPFRGPSLESTPEPIEDAREAQEVAGGASLDEWPEDALMYRCLASRGAQLTPDQEAVLAEWE